MPYIYKKKSVDNPGAPYDFDLIKDYNDIAEGVLELQRKIIGVKIVYDKEVYDSYKIDEPERKYSYCQMIRDAGNGIIKKSRLKHHMCDGGTTALALEPSNAHIENGSEYFSYDLYATAPSAKRMRKSIKSLHNDMGTTYGVVTGPLVKFKDLVPDIVLIIDRPYVIMRLTQGYVYNTGIKPEIDYGAMQAVCSELTVTPYLTGSMNISALCPSTRMLCSWKEEDMGLSLPYEEFINTIDGVIATSKATDSAPKRRSIVKRLEEANKELAEFFKK
ncbi:DUF169 domain-containing protein [Miniphocaeibacter halophilus]|uniref:DUF169 domain-containing protein n=1 Tax=Miniphocaeibacter halophilus TaxID=2931922 RepID=A0AC61N0K4_9FIRM|nr:DUF169 domain-containing protein [Miniphocaeibacter halophilus]QQK08531.1 DUF169 domain-containing protein [Miniphocaeibacter halophilus]